jgi:hypothetical protein
MWHMTIIDVMWLISMANTLALLLLLINAWLNLSLSLRIDGGPVKQQHDKIIDTTTQYGVKYFDGPLTQ